MEILASSSKEQLSLKDKKLGAMPLHWARTREMIMCLLKLGAVIDGKSNSQDTPLHIMLKRDRRDCVNTLLTMGADVSIPNHEGETPLHIAIPVSPRSCSTHFQYSQLSDLMSLD